MKKWAFALAAVLALLASVSWTLTRAQQMRWTYPNRTAYWVNRFESLLGGGINPAPGQLPELGIYAS